MLKKPKTLNSLTWTESEYISNIQNHLRRFRSWKPPNAVKSKAKRKSQSINKKLKYEYQCNHCKNWFAEKEIQIDHINPVVEVTGFTTWDNYISRLFVEENGYQVLCKPCHLIKSNAENTVRRENKKK